jgi:lysozyme family protein
MTIDEMLDDIIKKEGGYVNHKDDKGGETNFGITKKVYAEYLGKNPNLVSTADMKLLTRGTAKGIYKNEYFLKPKISTLPVEIQPIILDMAVNHGAKRAILILQEALISFACPVQVDGVIGQKTAYFAGTCDKTDLINEIVELRVRFYKQIITNNPSQKVFEKGWLARAESFREVV